MHSSAAGKDLPDTHRARVICHFPDDGFILLEQVLLAVVLLLEELERQGAPVRYDTPPSQQTAIERDVIEMEAELQAARLLTWRAAKMISSGAPNSLEASMAKAKAGLAVTQITQKAVELLGPAGYSKKLLVEKWMRDAKINDIYEGTQQINQLIIARRILDYPSAMLR